MIMTTRVFLLVLLMAGYAVVEGGAGIDCSSMTPESAMGKIDKFMDDLWQRVKSANNDLYKLEDEYSCLKDYKSDGNDGGAMMTKVNDMMLLLDYVRNTVNDKYAFLFNQYSNYDSTSGSRWRCGNGGGSASSNGGGNGNNRAGANSGGNGGYNSQTNSNRGGYGGNSGQAWSDSNAWAGSNSGGNGQSKSDQTSSSSNSWAVANGGGNSGYTSQKGGSGWGNKGGNSWSSGGGNYGGGNGANGWGSGMSNGGRGSGGSARRESMRRQKGGRNK